MMTSSQIALARLSMRSVQRGSNGTRNDLRCRKRWGQHEHQPCLSQWSRVVLYTELIVGMFTPFPLSNVCIRLYLASYFNVIISFIIIIINYILIILIVTKGSNDYIVIIAFKITHILICAPLEFWSHSSYDWRFGSHPYWWSKSHPQNRIVGEFPSLGHTWILRDCLFVYVCVFVFPVWYLSSSSYRSASRDLWMQWPESSSRLPFDLFMIDHHVSHGSILFCFRCHLSL